jgi:hypothetical protein
MKQQHVTNDGDLRRYFSQIPHLADDALNPYQMRLYVHYLRVCGNDGECYEGRATTAKTCQMSEGMVTKTRNQLAAGGWIILERGGDQNDTYHIRIVDRWEENMSKYKRSSPHDDPPAKEVIGSSPHDDGGHHMTTGRHQVTQRIILEEEPIKEDKKTTPANGTRAPSGHQAIIDVYVKELSYTPQNMGREVKAAAWLNKHGYAPDQVLACYRHLKRDKFWRDRFVSLQKVADEITEFSRNGHAPAQTYRKPTQAEIDAAKAAPIVEV